MAQAAKVRKSRPVANDAPKAAKTGNTIVDMDAEAEAAQAQAAAEAEARAAEVAEKVADVTGRMRDTLHDLTAADAASAVEARLQWVKVGRILAEARAVFTPEGSNNPSDKLFGQWIAENDFTALGHRTMRSAALWIAQVYDLKPDLYALFPTESTDGEPLRRSPRTLQAWVREKVYAAFQDAYEAAADKIGLPSEAEKDQREAVAKASMPNIYEAVMEQLEVAAENRDKAQEKLTKAKAADRAAAAADFTSAAAVYDELILRKSVLDQHSQDELMNYFIGWKPKKVAVAFKDCSVEDAAARMFALLKTHDEFSEVYGALGVLVAELAAKLDADAGAVDADAEPDVDADFDVDFDDADADDADEEEDDFADEEDDFADEEDDE